MSPTANRLWLCAGLAVVAFTFAWWYSRPHASNDPYDAPPMAFDGESDQLKRTVVVPTLDTPIPEGKSAVWCASFQLAWNRLKNDVAKGPVQLANAQPLADRLNRGDQSEADLDRDAVYAAAGLAKDGIVERIQKEMARRFPNVAQPELDVPPDGAVAYAYLAASAKFDIPFFENDEPFVFKDSSGKETKVGSFGVRKKDDYAYHRLRDQVQVLYCPRESIGTEREIPEFILDPCKTSRPYQVLLARVDRKPTLAETLADVEQKIEAKPGLDDYVSKMGPRDILLVPNMAWTVTHRFNDLEGRDKKFANPAIRGLYLDTALQTIRFRLDRSGAELASEAKAYVKPGASHFQLNRPFLVFMKKRGGGRPFFAMWVENAELLDKK